MQFDVAHPLVRPGIVGREADGQSERVEPRDAARPGGVPAELGLTPQNTLPAGLFCYVRIVGAEYAARRVGMSLISLVNAP